MSTCDERRARVKRLERRMLFWLAVTYWLGFSALMFAVSVGAYLLFDPPASVAWGGLGVTSAICLVLGWNYDAVLAALARTRRGRELHEGWTMLMNEYIGGSSG